MKLAPRTILFLALVFFLSFLLIHFVSPSPAASAPGTDPNEVWRQYLPELEKGHSDKQKLAWYATSLFRHIDAPVKDFAKKMNAEQKPLRDRLESWAKAHHISLKFDYGDDVAGKARKAMEKADGKIIEDDNNPNFQRDMLLDMQSDYDWQRHLIATLIPLATDPELKSYLQDSLKVHEAHFTEIRQLLDHYKWQN